MLGLMIAVAAGTFAQIVPVVLRANDVEPLKAVDKLFAKVTVSLVLSLKLTILPPAKSLKPRPAFSTRRGRLSEVLPAMLPFPAESEMSGLLIVVALAVPAAMFPFVLRVNDIELIKGVLRVLDRTTFSAVRSLRLTICPPAKRLSPSPPWLTMRALVAVPSPVMLPAAAVIEMLGLTIPVLVGVLA